MTGWFAAIDTRLFLFLNTTFAHPALDWFFVTITCSSNWVLPLVAAAVLALIEIEARPVRIRFRADWKRRIVIIVSALVAVGISDRFCDGVLKPLFGRLRPCHPDALVEGARFLIGYKRSLSMPSIHAANMLTLATVLTWAWPKWWVVFFVPAVLVAFSRVYVGVHYPGDVVAGMVVGGVIGSGVYLLSSWIRSRAANRFGGQSRVTPG